jgi:hypothetical protein
MESYPAETDLVLVGVLPAQRDLEIARLLGWYRIPLRKAPKVIEVDYLAFYQTSAFGEADRWRIQYAAAVRGHELTTRRRLLQDEPDHPHAGEEYYKVALGPLLHLTQPVLAGGWKRVTFLYTTGRHLLQAHTLNDLVVRSEERDVLWRSLRERALRSGKYQAADLPEMAIDPALLVMLGALGLSIGEAGADYPLLTGGN